MTLTVLIPAAGLSSRLGDPSRHKLLATLEGVPLIRRAALTAMGAGFTQVIVVTGAKEREMTLALKGLSTLRLVHNPDFAQGMASSLKAGFRALPQPGPCGLMILLPDMPLISAEHLQQMSAAFTGQNVVRAVCQGQSGNPLILPPAIYTRLPELSGDHGAKRLIETSGTPITPVEIGPAALQDADTVEALLALGARL